MLKVAIIQNIIVPYEIPLLELLGAEKNIDLKVFFCKDTYKERKWKIIDSNAFDYEILKGLTFETPLFISSINPSIINKLNKFRPDLIIISGGYLHLTSLLSIIYSRIAGIPIIYRSDETTYTRQNISRLYGLSSVIEKFIINKCNAIICPSKDSKDYHLKMGASKKKVFVSPYTTSNDNLYYKKSIKYRRRKNKIKMELGINQENVIIFVGQIIERKGLIYLLDSFKKLSIDRNIALVIIGDGPKLNFYKSYCYTNNLKNIYFPGFVDEDLKIKYYSISDVFVLPSLKDHWGVVVNEAMLCGLPIILTKVTGAKEMVEVEKNGFIVDENDSNQIFIALKTMFSNKIMINFMKEKSLEIVRKNYNIDKRLEGFLSAIHFSINYFF